MPDSVQENLALARRGHELWNAEGLEGSVEQVWAPDIVFNEAAEVPDSAIFAARRPSPPAPGS